MTSILAAGGTWAYYKASVAQSLAAEIGQQLGCSLTGYSADQLAQLFDSRQMFRWNAAPAGYCIDSMHGHLVPGPPARSYEFLGTSILIANDRLTTLANVVGWCRANLVHFSGGTTAAWRASSTAHCRRRILHSGPTMHRTAGC